MSFEDSESQWKATLSQLQGYMLTSHNVLGNVQEMYGLVGIGKRVKFYILRTNKDYLEYFLFNEHLHVEGEEDSVTIDGTLQFLVRHIGSEI